MKTPGGASFDDLSGPAPGSLARGRLSVSTFLVLGAQAVPPDVARPEPWPLHLPGSRPESEPYLLRPLSDAVCLQEIEKVVGRDHATYPKLLGTAGIAF